MPDPNPIAALDVGYGSAGAIGAGVLFDAWGASEATCELTFRTEVSSSEYVAGEFYRRELPILLALLPQLRPVARTIIVDGYVWLNDGRPGLGAHLWEALDRKPIVIGVAKRRFRDAPGIEVLRGKSSNPLYITAAGLAPEDGAARIAAMHGPYRIPTMLRRADRLSRGR